MSIMYLAWRGEWRLPPLNGIATAPLLQDDGMISSSEGYDPVSGMWCEHVPKLTGLVPDRPTKDDAAAALSLVRKTFRTFCFSDAQMINDDPACVPVVDLTKPPGRDESSLLVALLTAVCRPSLHLAPGVLLRAAPAIGGADRLGDGGRADAAGGAGVRGFALGRSNDAGCAAGHRRARRTGTFVHGGHGLARVPAALGQALASRHALPREVVEDVAARTGGVPLFVEEVTRLLLERGEQGGIQAIPPTLQQSLMARLDRLGPAREVAQVGAVIGRGFSYGLLRALAGMDDAPLRTALERLAEADILLVEGLPPKSDYRFKHALIQDAAYENLLKSRRHVLHRQAAEPFVSNFSDTVERSPELVAHHYSEAGLAAQAVTYWHRAGERAVQQSANLEAIGHLTTGLAQLAQVSETQERAKQELALQRLLGQASFATKGYAFPEASRAFNRARELCAATGDDVGICPILFGVWLFEIGNSYHANAEMIANEILERAGRMENTGARIAGYCAVEISGVHLATLAHARMHFDKVIGDCRTFTREEATRLAYEYGVDMPAACFAYGAWCFWLLGYPDQALRLGDEALAIVERIQHGYFHSRCFYLNSALHAYRREWPIVEERAAAAIAAAQERELAMVVAVGRIMQGAARAMLDPRDQSVAEIREALAAYRATGARIQSTYHLILLAQALAASGRYGEGLSALREAASLAEETGERFVAAEIHRVKGNLLLAENGSGDAEACYVKAMGVARAQEARSLELRAACDLARLWTGRGERSRAADLLAAVYGWFTEGFDTADLKEAKSLLDELA